MVCAMSLTSQSSGYRSNILPQQGSPRCDSKFSGFVRAKRRGIPLANTGTRQFEFGGGDRTGSAIVRGTRAGSVGSVVLRSLRLGVLGMGSGKMRANIL